MTELRKKPLVEAILEVRWRLPQPKAGQQLPPGDPHYQLMLGRFYDRIRSTYPSHEALPAAQVPAGLLGQVVQHRFRTAPNAWPLIQLGSGILTVNDTTLYTWSDFRHRAIYAVEQFFAAHPNPADLNVERISLRYVDGIPFDSAGANLTAFLHDQLKLTVELPDDVFTTVGLTPAPQAFQWHASYPSTDGTRMLSAKIVQGMKGNEPSIILDTSVDTAGIAIVPNLPEEFGSWIDAAHELASGWFKELTKGPLYAGFEPAEAN